MISKLGLGIFLSVATLFFATPTNASAATSSADKAKIKKYSKQLNALPTGAAPASKVNSLVTKLTKLDPKKATKYYKIGLTKLGNAGGTFQANATKIALAVAKALKKAGLPTSTTDKLIKQITAANEDAQPTPSASAMVSPLDHSWVVA